MKGILFGKLHSYRDLKLLLLPGKEIGSPEVKKKLLDVEGADGTIDYTDFFGEPKYSDVTHKFPFATLVPMKDFLSNYSAVKSALHGKKMPVILDDEPGYFYAGRIYVQPFTCEKNIGHITIEAECEPYKYKLEKTTVTRAVDGTGNIVLTNARKRAVPEVTIETETSINIQYGSGFIWDLGPGTYTLPELELAEGENPVTVTGTGTISFTWQEGAL